VFPDHVFGVPVTFHECVVVDLRLEFPAFAACGAQIGRSVVPRPAGWNDGWSAAGEPIPAFRDHLPGVLASGAAPFLRSAPRRLAMIERISPIFELIAPNCSFRILSPR
jgi:hypothetical protein